MKRCDALESSVTMAMPRRLSMTDLLDGVPYPFVDMTMAGPRIIEHDDGVDCEFIPDVIYDQIVSCPIMFGDMIPVRVSDDGDRHLWRQEEESMNEIVRKATPKGSFQPRKIDTSNPVFGDGGDPNALSAMKPCPSCGQLIKSWKFFCKVCSDAEEAKDWQ